MRSLLPLLLLLPAALSAQANQPAATRPPLAPDVLPAPAVALPRFDQAVAVDGRLDEPVWAAGGAAGRLSAVPAGGLATRPKIPPSCWCGTRPTAIHFGIRAYDRVPASVRATVSDRDNIGNDDQVTIYLDTFNDRRRAYFFGVNPYGIQDDGVRSEGGFTRQQRRFRDHRPQPGLHLAEQGDEDRLRVGGRSARALQVAAVEQRVTSSPGGSTCRASRAAPATRTRGPTCAARTRRSSRRPARITGLHDINRGVVTEVQPTITADLSGGARRTTARFGASGLRTDVGAQPPASASRSSRSTPRSTRTSRRWSRTPGW